MNKEGFLLAEFTLKVVIAILGILLLIGLLFGFYGVFSDSNDIAKAESTLNEIIERVNVASSGGEDLDFIITGPDGWYFVYFGNGGPQSCFGESCLCICEKSDVESCDKKGSCQRSPEVNEFNSRRIDGPTQIFIRNEGGLKIE